MKKLIITVVVLALFILAYFLATNKPTQPSKSLTDVVKDVIPLPQTKGRKDREIIAQDLDIPWEVAFLPDGDYLVTERPGNLLKVGKDKKIIKVQGVQHVGEGGLMGLTLHPKFKENNLLYLYFTTGSGGNLTNKLERYKFDGNTISERKVVLEGVRGSSNHDGGRIAFGPDGNLYIGTGDAEQPEVAQNTKSLNGKILRIKDDGSIPSDNPFGNAVYSYGHRNVQGLTWDDRGNLWATEHGRSGFQSGFDELNLIEMGKNYGWPTIQGDEERAGMVRPVVHSGGSETWAPGGATYLNGSIFFVGLRGATLYEAKLNGKAVGKLKKHLKDEYGRIRSVQVGPDKMLYITTSNRDGRGIPKQSDDKLIRINPNALR